MRPGGARLKGRIVPIVAIVLVACGGPSTTDAPRASAADPPVVLPASALPRMTSDVTSVDVDRLANEVVHPDELQALLDEALNTWNQAVGK